MKYLGITSIVIGIIALVLTFIPSTRLIALIVAIIGALIGLAGVILKSKDDSAPKTMDIIGTAANVVALIIYIIFLLI